MNRITIVVALLTSCAESASQSHPIPGDRGPAITVEVLNANGRVGDARIGTRLLRRAGIDVVYYGNASVPDTGLDFTRIIVRRGSVDRGERVRSALGGGRVQIDLDSNRLLDVSVLLGADFAPAPPRSRSLDFHP
ncbi:MAG TPA: LytR C-terminal domain-containing protein [Gemmatimonadales bacterium]|nr:LytR C-terminal domain-containing protein [Gemmatimonadales bacterium]